MSERSSARRRRGVKAVAVAVAVSIACALLFASQLVTLRPTLDGKQVGFRYAFTGALAYCLVWAALAAPIKVLVRRFPIGPSRWRSGILAHSIGGSLLSALQIAFFATVVWGLAALGAVQSTLEPAPSSFIDLFTMQFVRTIHTNIFVYAAILGVIHAIDYQRKYHDRQVRTSRLETQLAHAQLSALRMQLHPHFLFNTLNAIAALTRDDPRAAEQMIVRLSELLRMALDNVGTQQHTLREELALLGKYLEIEQIRFGKRLNVRKRIATTEFATLVPTLILQPLVENAVRHGVSPGDQTCVIEIEAQSHNDQLEIVIRDTGPGLREPIGAIREGVGLSNTRARLQQMYGAKQSFQIGSQVEAGFEVRLTIPRHLDTAAKSAASGEVLAVGEGL